MLAKYTITGNKFVSDTRLNDSVGADAETLTLVATALEKLVSKQKTKNSGVYPEMASNKKTHKEKKHLNKIFTGLSRDFGGDFVYVFFSPIRNDPKKYINKFLAPTQSQDNPANLFMFMCFFFP